MSRDTSDVSDLSDNLNYAPSTILPYLAVMLIYNVTSKVDLRVHAAWLKWMENHYLPAQTATNLVVSYQLTRLLNVDDTQGPTYALLLSFNKREDYKRYHIKYLKGFEKAVREKWGDDVLSFASTLDVVVRS